MVRRRGHQGSLLRSQNPCSGCNTLCLSSGWSMAYLTRHRRAVWQCLLPTWLRMLVSSSEFRFHMKCCSEQSEHRFLIPSDAHCLTCCNSPGIPRILVDVRHDASHNELPSLALLRLASTAAVSWLSSAYWQRQADHLLSCRAHISSLLQVAASTS